MAGLSLVLGRDGLQVLEEERDVAPLAAQEGRPELLEGPGVPGFEKPVLERLPETFDLVQQVLERDVAALLTGNISENI